MTDERAWLARNSNLQKPFDVKEAEELDETKALERLKKGDERALEWFVKRYTPYVGAVVWAVIGGRLSVQDGEEIAADVFLTLWRSREKVREGAVRGYLGAIARTRAIDRLRRASALPELAYDELDGAVEGPESGVLEKEERKALLAAVDALGEPDREIFLRRYYLCQSAPDIGEKLGMTAEAVRQRLKRGRDAIKTQLTKD